MRPEEPVGGRSLTSLLVAIADYPEALKDLDSGRERGVLADAVQLSLAPLDAETLVGPDRAALDGDGRVAGRLVLCDRGLSGRMRSCAGWVASSPCRPGRPWLSIASNLDQGRRCRRSTARGPASPDGHGHPRSSRAGRDARTLRRGTGRRGGGHSEQPRRQVLHARRSRTRNACSSTKAILTGWEQSLPHKEPADAASLELRGTSLPELPDSTLRKQVLLALRVTGSGDSGLVRQALARWGDRRLHST